MNTSLFNDFDKKTGGSHENRDPFPHNRFVVKKKNLNKIVLKMLQSP